MLRRSLVALLILTIATPAAAAPANTLNEMFGQLRQCVRSPRITPGFDVTLQFSLNRRGGLIGKPRISHAIFPDDPSIRAEFARSIATAFDACLPLSITDALGGAIAGRMITYRLTGVEKGTGL